MEMSIKKRIEKEVNSGEYLCAPLAANYECGAIQEGDQVITWIYDEGEIKAVKKMKLQEENGRLFFVKRKQQYFLDSMMQYIH